jgi:hypothetical protein
MRIISELEGKILKSYLEKARDNRKSVYCLKDKEEYKRKMFDEEQNFCLLLDKRDNVINLFDIACYLSNESTEAKLYLNLTPIYEHHQS